MPHCIIEYARELESEHSIQNLVEQVHRSAAETGLFQPEDIKTRAIPVDHYFSENPSNTFVHVTAKILSGRTEEQKKHLSRSLLTTLDTELPQASIKTVEVVDIDRASYAKKVR